MAGKSLVYILFLFGILCKGFVWTSAEDTVENKHNVLSKKFKLFSEEMKNHDERLKSLENDTNTKSCGKKTDVHQDKVSGAFTEEQLTAIQDNIEQMKDYLNHMSKGLAAEKVVRIKNSNAIKKNDDNIVQLVQQVNNSTVELYQQFSEQKKDEGNCLKEIEEKFKLQKDEINSHTAEMIDSLKESIKSQFDKQERQLKSEMKDVIIGIEKIQNVVNLMSSVIFTNFNLAKGKKAKQSSILGGGYASNAVDGNRSGNWGISPCTHTIHEKNPWWQVDLAGLYPIKRVVIKNRGDCCGERLHNLVISVRNEEDGTEITCGNFKGPGMNDAEYTILCDQAIMGRYLKIQIFDDNLSYLTLCEVEVYST